MAESVEKIRIPDRYRSLAIGCHALEAGRDGERKEVSLANYLPLGSETTTRNRRIQPSIEVEKWRNILIPTQKSTIALRRSLL
jgi:hypothetical protein